MIYKLFERLLKPKKLEDSNSTESILEENRRNRSQLHELQNRILIIARSSGDDSGNNNDMRIKESSRFNALPSIRDLDVA